MEMKVLAISSFLSFAEIQHITLFKRHVKALSKF